MIMKLLRRTTPVALVVGAVIAVLYSSIQVVDGIFANPQVFTSAGILLGYVFRIYFLYLLFFGIFLFLINLFLCIFFRRRMRDADYPRLVEYEVLVSAFILLFLLYLWKDKETVMDILRERHGLLPRIFLFGEATLIIGFISFIIAGAVHQLVRRLPGRQLAVYISSVAWFILLLPLIGEAVLFSITPHWHPLLELLVLIILAFVLAFVIKFLNRFTMALIGLKRSAWLGLSILVVIGFISWGAIALLHPKPGYRPRSGNEVNIVLLSIDALRADHLGCYGYKPENPMIEPGQFTPNIDKFASEGLLFEQAHSTAPWTLPSMASWMTGGWPAETGGTYINRRLYRSMTTLPEALREEGYSCAAFTCNPFLGSETDIGRGFDKYWEFFHSSRLTSGLFIDELNFKLMGRIDALGIYDVGRMIADRQMSSVCKWLDKHQKDKFFLWVHLYDPHYPYIPPSPYKEKLPDIGGQRRAPVFNALSNVRRGSGTLKYGARRHIVNLYDGEVQFSDEVTGDILAKLDELDLTKDTLFIITADHGEELFDHNGLEHGHTEYRELLHVPLIFKLPGRIPAGDRIRERTSLIDLFPTLLDFASASVEPKLYRGESLKSAILSGDMSAAGKGQMNLTPGGGGKGIDTSLPTTAEDSWFDYTRGENPEGEFTEGGRYFEPGFAYDSSSGTYDITPEGAVEKAAGVLRQTAASRLEGGVSGFAQPEGRIIFAEDLFYFDNDLQAISIGGWKLIHSRNRFHDPVIWDVSVEQMGITIPKAFGFVEEDELYNIADDPYEKENVIYEQHEIARFLLERLKTIDYFDRREAVTRKQIEGEMTYFGAGLKNLTRGFGYW